MDNRKLQEFCGKIGEMIDSVPGTDEAAGIVARFEGAIAAINDISKEPL